MREHKFRAFDKRTKTMIATGYHVIGEVTMFNMIEAYLDEHREGLTLLERLNDVVVMQFTGKKDWQNTPIYEGDIIEFDIDEWGDANNKFVVEWDDTNAGWSFGGGIVSDMDFRTVIGNIYEHHHLLKT